MSRKHFLGFRKHFCECKSSELAAGISPWLCMDRYLCLMVVESVIEIKYDLGERKSNS